MLDNTNQIFSLCSKEPEIGTLWECFFCNQLASAGHKVEYGGIKTGDFRIDNDIVIEVGGASKGMAQISDEDKGKAALAVDDIDMAAGNKIPLWAFGFLYWSLHLTHSLKEQALIQERTSKSRLNCVLARCHWTGTELQI